MADNPWAKTSSSGGGANPWGKSTSTNRNTTKAALTSIKKNQAYDDGGLWGNTVSALGKGIDFLDKLRNTVDSSLYEFTRPNQSFDQRFSSGLSGLKNGFTGQEHKSFNDVLSNAGPNWQNPALGFIGDVVTDPLTYLSFGGTSVAKGVLKPFVNKALEEVAQKGAVKGTEEYAKIMAKHTQSDAAINALKAAQAQANKSLISVGVPFGKKLTLANKPLMFQKQTQKISTQAAQSLNDAITKAGMTNRAQRLDLISHMVGRPVSSVKDLNTQEFDFVNQLWHDHVGNSVTTHMSNLPDPFAGLAKPSNKANTKAWKKFIQTNYSNSLHQLPKSIDQMTKKELQQAAKDLNVNYTHALGQAVGNVKNDFTNLGKTFTHYDGLTGFSPATKKLFVKDSGQATKLGQAQEKFGQLFGSRRFTSLASQIGDHRTAQGLGHILNAGNKAYAYSHQAIEKLKDIAKTPEFKSLTPDEWKEVAYTIEGKRPSYAGYTAPDPARQAVIDKVAHSLVGNPNDPNAEYFMKHINDIENAAQLKRGNRANYFPHVYNIQNPVDFQDLQAELLNMGNRGKQIATGLKYGKSGFQKGRTQFETMADLTDALDAAKQAGNTNLLDRYNDVSWNPLEAFGKRAINGMHQVAKKESIDAVVRDGLALNRTKNVPPGWVEVGANREIPKGSPLEELKGKVVPKEVHGDLEKINKLLTNDTALNNFMDHADKILSILRRNYTVTKLGFHVRQSIGNIFQNTLAGVSPQAYGQAAKFLAHPERYPQWQKEVLENGVIHTGTSGADLANNLGEDLNTKIGAKTIGQSLNPVGSKFILASVGRKAGEYEDNIARTAHYFYMRNKGLSQQAAADSVRKYLFNYSEISTAGQAIRRVVPFYQWMRNNLPFQIVNTLKNPKAYNIAQNFLRNFQNAPSSEDAMNQAGINPMNQEMVQKIIEENGGVLPKYIQDNYINIPGLGYYSIGLPTQDVKEAASNPAQYFFGSMNPYINLISEMRSNQNSLNGAAIDKSVPTGQSIWTTPTGMNHIAETALGSPWQILNGLFRGTTQGAKLGQGDYSNALKGIGLNTQKMDPTKGVNNLLYQKALELSTKAKAARDATNGGN